MKDTKNNFYTMRVYQKIGMLVSLAVCLAGCDAAVGSLKKGPEGQHLFNESYSGDYLSRIAFPIGGLGAGMFCLEGTGYISHMSVRNRPDIFHEPGMFAALHVVGLEQGSKVLEGPVPEWRKFGLPGSGLGAAGSDYGLPRFTEAAFQARFPFAQVSLTDADIPVGVTLTGWSPFIPGDADNSGLPVGILEYAFENNSGKELQAVFSFHSRNFMRVWNRGENRVRPLARGFVLSQTGTREEPFHQGEFAVFTDQPNTVVNHCWFRGGWFDGMTMAWNAVARGEMQAVPAVEKDAPGASLYVPVVLKPGEKKTVKVFMAWYVPDTDMRIGGDPKDPGDNRVPPGRSSAGSEEAACRTYRPWYAGRFANVDAVAHYLVAQYEELHRRTALFTEALYTTTLPREVIEAVASNLSILKSPTVLRQTDGRLWNWEGCGDQGGSCHGSCTHVWNYAQAIPHLFPALERTLRHTEFEESQDLRGHQTFRSNLPIRPVEHGFHSAADGQLGGIIKVYRDWRISGDDAFLRAMYPNVRSSLDYCIATWDPRRVGSIEEPHHNTYDIEFWGPDGMHNSFYLSALEAFVAMSEYLGEEADSYKELFAKGKRFTETELFDGEYFIQKIQWKGLRANDPTTEQSFGGAYSPEARALMEKEGPKYQYGAGCLSDGILGVWMALVSGLDNPLDEVKTKSHLNAVYTYNLKKDLSKHANPQRPAFAFGTDGGLLLCTWPKGGKLSLPFVYSDEVWTGIEYQVASHLMLAGEVEKGLDIVRTCRRRYDGRVRNPFDEYECGHWYARALASYGLLQGLTGVRYDAVDKTLYIDSQIGDFTGFLSTATGFGQVGLKNGRPFVSWALGGAEVKRVIVSGREMSL